MGNRKAFSPERMCHPKKYLYTMKSVAMNDFPMVAQYGTSTRRTGRETEPSVVKNDTFLVKLAAMGQRLSRAKTKIRAARIPYEIPVANDLPARLDAVLEAIYAAYGRGWDDIAGADAHRRGLRDEAIDLGRLLHRLLPTEPEVQGLLALMLHCEGRRQARRAADSTYVPLPE